MFQHLAREASKLHSLSLFKVHELVNLRVQAFLQVQRFLSQPFFVAEIFTGTPGAFVDLETTSGAHAQVRVSILGVEGCLVARGLILVVSCQVHLPVYTVEDWRDNGADDGRSR